MKSDHAGPLRPDRFSIRIWRKGRQYLIAVDLDADQAWDRFKKAIADETERWHKRRLDRRGRSKVRIEIREDRGNGVTETVVSIGNRPS